MLNPSTTENPSAFESRTIEQSQTLSEPACPSSERSRGAAFEAPTELPQFPAAGAAGDLGLNPDSKGGDSQPGRRTRAEISRANSQHSTGPRTSEGKVISRANAFKHGLCAQSLILPDDDIQAFVAYSRNLANNLRVDGELEQTLAQNMSDSQYQIERARAIENNILQLRALEQTDQNDPTRDFQMDHLVGMARSFEENIKTLDLISRYTARHTRAFLQNHARLREVQAHRLNGNYARQNDRKRKHNQAAASGFVPQPGSTGLPACENPARAGHPNPKTIHQIAIEAIRNRKNKAA